MEKIISDEEKIRRAEIIANRRQNRIPVKDINNYKKNKMSKLTKSSIQILISICIFGLMYFLSQHNSEFIAKVRPKLTEDTNFKQIYMELNVAMKKFLSENDEKNIENKSENEGTQSNEVINKKEENSIATNNTEEQNGVGGGDDGTKKSENEDDIVYLKNNFSFIKPVNAVVTSPYGERIPTDIISKNHNGVDLGCNNGTEIKAAMNGTVTKVSNYGDYGMHLQIVNKDVSTLYAHCSEILAKEGDNITQGQIIAKVGSTGKATGPHLHFEIRRNDRTIDPQKILSFN